MTKTLYDKTGAAFSLDHEIDGTAYSRPMVKVVSYITNRYGDEEEQVEDWEPAAYMVSMPRADLFDMPPIVHVDAEVAAAQAALERLKAEAAREARRIKSEASAAERELIAAKRQLDEWMGKHRAMIELGKLLDGQVLYPLSVSENSYHHGRNIPEIPTMRNISYLAVTAGNFEKGQAWKCKNYLSDHYGSNFRFYDTEADRAAVIAEEFGLACDRFRQRPNFDTTSHTSGTTLHYGTLCRWVQTHPALNIPDDIEAMKAESDAKVVEARRARLADELAAMDRTA